MFRVVSNRVSSNCEGVSRREFIRVGSLGLGGLSLASLMRTRAALAAEGHVVSDKAVVVLYLQGGPTHIETFDPKMTAPSEIRAMFGEVATRLPGVTYGSHFPQLAQLAHKMAIVRSYGHGISSHAKASEHVITGGNPLGASMGSIYGRVAGLTNPATGIPNNTVITPGCIGSRYRNLGAQLERITPTGTLPTAFAPFDPSAGGEIIENMKLRIPEERLDDRRHLLVNLDRIKREIDASGALDGADKFQQQAFDVILGGVSEAFDLSKEDPRLVERYDTSHIDIPQELYRRKNQNLLKQSPITLGKQMLMARRLIESGCGFVTVTSAGWDMHGNAFGVDDGMPILGSAVDRAASVFLEDLEQRGLSDKVLLVITGEFGRTPKINSKGGRDHWGNLCTLAFAGGGLPMGQVIGASDRMAGVPDGDPVTSGNVLATVMHALFDIGLLRLETGLPSDLVRALTSNEPIPQLV